MPIKIEFINRDKRKIKYYQNWEKFGNTDLGTGPKNLQIKKTFKNKS